MFSNELWPGNRIVTVWFAMKPMSTFFLHVFLFFFFFQPTIVDFVNCEQCICVLFMIPQIILFSNFFIKNGSHNTIYTFKNYFVTVFSVLVFNFSKNKLNPNTPIVSDGFRFLEKQQNFTNKIEENYCVLPEYHKCVFSSLTWMVGYTN